MEKENQKSGLGKSGPQKGFIICGYLALFLAAALLFLSVAAPQTLSWLNPQETAVLDLSISDFTVKGSASFQGAGGSAGAGGAGGWAAAADLSGINLTDPNSARYLGKLSFRVKYTGISPAYLRVRILEQWVDKSTDTIKDVPFTDYRLSGDSLAEGKWFDNRANDFCYYYKEPIGPGMMTALAGSGSDPAAFRPAPQTVDIPFFDGVDMTGIHADPNTELTLIIEVQAVQPNRYREFWGIDRLPWE